MDGGVCPKGKIKAALYPRAKIFSGFMVLRAYTGDNPDKPYLAMIILGKTENRNPELIENHNLYRLFLFIGNCFDI